MCDGVCKLNTRKCEFGFGTGTCMGPSKVQCCLNEGSGNSTEKEIGPDLGHNSADEKPEMVPSNNSAVNEPGMKPSSNSTLKEPVMEQSNNSKVKEPGMEPTNTILWNVLGSVLGAVATIAAAFIGVCCVRRNRTEKVFVL